MLVRLAESFQRTHMPQVSIKVKLLDFVKSISIWNILIQLLEP